MQGERMKMLPYIVIFVTPKDEMPVTYYTFASSPLAAVNACLRDESDVNLEAGVYVHRLEYGVLTMVGHFWQPRLIL